MDVIAKNDLRNACLDLTLSSSTFHSMSSFLLELHDTKSFQTFAGVIGGVNLYTYRRSKSVHLRTLTHALEGRGNVHCGGIFRDPRLTSPGAEHQPDLTKDRVSPKYGTEIPCCTNRADIGTPQDTTEQTRSVQGVYSAAYL